MTETNGPVVERRIDGPMSKAPLPPFDPEAHRRDLTDLTPARSTYLVLFTPRSGSTWLTKVLSATGHHGIPREYVNEVQLPGYMGIVNADDRPGYFEMLRRKRKTANGVFGLKATAPQIRMFGEDAFFAGLPSDTRVFVMWRRNIVAQGISLYRAVATRRFHSFQTEAGEALAYDADQIRRWVETVMHVENQNWRLARRRGLVPTVFSYEDLGGDASAALELFAPVLAAATPPDGVADATAVDRRFVPRKALEKIGDGWNADAEARFRGSHGDFVARTEAQRLTITNPGPIRYRFERTLDRLRSAPGRLAAMIGGRP